MGAAGNVDRHPSITLCSTPFGIRDGCRFAFAHFFPIYIVLNAFRHQRWVQAIFWDTFLHAFLCSTPFGIRDGCSMRSGILVCGDIVLNAFRHQRWVQPIRQYRDGHRGCQCSTPFGIRDGCSWDRRPKRIRVDTCSTPFGIRDGCSAQKVILQ